METKSLHEQLTQRYEDGIRNLNNFATGTYDIDIDENLNGDLDICAIDLDDASRVLVTPKSSIWGDAYKSHKFFFSVEDLSDNMLNVLCNAIESEFSHLATMWENA